MPPLRILVLTSSTGGGHDARAQAFAEWCFQLYRYDVDVRIEQMLEGSSRVYRGGVNFYNWIQRRSPWVHKAFYTIVEGLSFLNQRTVTFGRLYYERVVREYRPHLIFSVHDCLNRGYFQLARKMLGAANVRCATYCGEFSGGWGYSRNWVEPTVDLYFSRTPTAGDFALKIGLPRGRARVRGHLMQPRAYLETLSPEERRRYREKLLGLHRDRFTVFLATGANGANNHFDLLPALVRHADRVQAIVICGRNHQTYNELVHWRAQHPEFSCFIDSFSDVMHLLMQASDAIVTRGGTTTCANALHFRCPIIFNGFGGIMPQERLTVKFFRNGAGAEVVSNGAHFRDLIDRWMGEPGAYPRALANFLQLRYEEDPTVLIQELVGLAEEVSGIKLTRQPFPPPPGENGNGHQL
ncbi:MAG TPA: glycosyltransferase [Opitutaceae bacterium]|nr:glycosyltransferase [Opitutaceae bacterium]